jgi:hypothetical protein
MKNYKANSFTGLCDSLENGETIDMFTINSGDIYTDRLSAKYKENLFIAVNKNHYIYRLVV